MLLLSLQLLQPTSLNSKPSKRPNWVKPSSTLSLSNWTPENPLTTSSTCYTPSKTDTLLTKRRMMLTTKLSKPDVMMTSLDYPPKSPTLKRRTPNSKLSSMTWTDKETKRTPREPPSFWKRKNSKRLLTKLPTRDPKKPTDLKRRDKNSNSSHPSLLKPEDSSPITSTPPHSSKPENPKPSMSPHKSWPKLPNTSPRVPTKPAKWTTLSPSPEPLSSSLNWLQEPKPPKTLN